MTVEETFQAFGEELKQARIAKGRSLDDIASTTKIHVRHLEAIEAGDVSRLPQGPYVKAFVREYARAVGMTVPDAFAIPEAGPARSQKDPKVVSRPVGTTSSTKGSASNDDYGLPAVARETARKANTAVKSAVKTVSKTTGSVVNMVESSSKEALEVLTSKSLWDEAEDVRRERLGLPPLERPIEARTAQATRIEEKRQRVEKLSAEQPSTPSPRYAPEPTEASGEPGSARRFSVASLLGSSKRTTNVVIGLLALLFAAAAYFAIRISHTQSASAPVTDYVPAPVEKPNPLTTQKHDKPAAPPVASLPPAPTSSTDSLRFVLRALQPVWISILPDGIPAYRGELKAGEVRTFKAAGKIEVNLGNQKAVEMQFNGQALSNLPTIQNSNLVVRNLVLTRDRVTLGGQTLDLKKLTPPPPHSQQSVAVIPPPPSRASVPPAKAVPVPKDKSAAVTPPGNNSAGNKAKVSTPKIGNTSQSKVNSASKAPTSKATSPKKTPAAKPSKKQKNPPSSPGVIHPVEPIPPRL